MASLLVSAVTYAGLALALAGAVCVLKPLRALRIRSRRAALALLLAGVLLAATGGWWPWPEQRGSGGSQLDVFVPVYQFVEVHETRVRGTPEAVYRAIRAVRADEIRTFRTLTWIRTPRLRVTRESIMAPGQDPILDIATRTGFVWLADDAGREAAVGAVVCCRGKRLKDADDFRALTQPGYAKAGMNFRVEDQGGGLCRVTTETRVFATDAAARRSFGLYWAFIYPGSALIRHGWLRAIKLRAEAS